MGVKICLSLAALFLFSLSKQGIVVKYRWEAKFHKTERSSIKIA
jgi:hypothetical protein